MVTINCPECLTPLPVFDDAHAEDSLIRCPRCEGLLEIRVGKDSSGRVVFVTTTRFYPRAERQAANE